MATDQQEAAKLEQLSHLNPDELEHAAGREREQLEGWIPALASDDEVREALEKGVRLPRRHHRDVEGWQQGRGLSVRPPDRPYACGLLHPDHPDQPDARVNDCLRRRGGAGFHGPRHGCGQDALRPG